MSSVISFSTVQLYDRSYIHLHALKVFAITFLHTATQLTSVFDAHWLQDFPLGTE